MWHPLESWQLAQLQRLAEIDPEQVETLLNILWHSQPSILPELVIGAVDQETLSVAEAAQHLAISEEDVMARLQHFRSLRAASEAVQIDAWNVARLRNGMVAVWEIVREYRKIGSVERLERSFPSLTRGVLAAALKYAEHNPEEIENQILRYEDVRHRRLLQYPYAR